MGLEWTLDSGTVTESGCRTLTEVAATFERIGPAETRPQPAPVDEQDEQREKGESNGETEAKPAAPRLPAPPRVWRRACRASGFGSSTRR